jgi:hypothetical protein
MGKVSVRYSVDDVDAAVGFYSQRLASRSRYVRGQASRRWSEAISACY